MSGSPSQRVVVVTAKGRNLSALMCPIEDAMLSNMTCTCPLSRSVAQPASRDTEHEAC